MSAAPFQLLLLEDNAGDARLVQVALAEHAPGEFAVTCVERLADALARLEEERFDAVLCDLGLPDSAGLATAQAIAARAPALPLVVLTGLNNQDIGRAAIQQGAQDYLVKGEAGGSIIARTLRYAIERKRLEIELHEANATLERRVAERTSELEAALTKLHESLSSSRALAETATDAIITADHEGTIVQWNRAAERIFGYAQAEALGQPLTLVIPDRYRGGHFVGVKRVQADGERHIIGRTVEYHGLTKAGGEFPLELSVSTWETSEGRMFAGIIRDITERKRVALELLLQRNLYAMLSQTNQTIVRCGNAEELFPAVCRIAVEHGRFLFVWIGLIGKDQRLEPVARYGEDSGYVSRLRISRDESDPWGRGIIGQVLRTGERGVNNETLDDHVGAPWQDAARRAGVRSLASLPLRRGGAVIGALNIYSVEPGFFTEELLATLDEMAADISFALENFEREAERRRMEEALRAAEEQFRSLTAMSSDFYWQSDAEHRFLPRGRGGKPAIVTGFANDAQVGLRRWEIPHVSPDEAGWQAHRAVLDAHRPFRDFENSRLGPDGTVRHVLISGDPVFDASGVFKGYRGVGTDITERKSAERELHESEERFRGLVEQSITGIYIIQDNRFAYVNPRFAEIFGYGSAEELIGTDSLAVVAEQERDSVAKNVRRRIEGEVQSLSYVFTGIRKDGSTVDVGLNSARASYRSRPAIIGILQDISQKKRAEEQIQHYIVQLENTFMRAVEIATTLSEMRDPYTVGHERRVGETAAAIGAELGFDARRVEGLRVAGYLHDVGKITIPVEILTRPGKLTPVEFQLIKGHSQASYDILKSVQFPWPVAEIALQHHERLDGSGYPQGLKGDAILLEARIMAVADVVEAMSSHRPYRPGLGIEKALAEIERGRGTAYDADVADACLHLFREKGYAIAG